MIRLLGLLLLIGLGWLVLQRVFGARRPRQDRPEPPHSDEPPRFDKTVRCARCGVHLPLALARAEGDGHVCAEPGCEMQRRDKEPRERR